MHLIAIAKSIGVKLTMDDFDRIADKVPHLADLKPSGKYVAADLDRIGGIPAVMKMLMDAKIDSWGLPDGDRKDRDRKPQTGPAPFQEPAHHP